jgi:SulP family sulfate permease
VSHAAPPPWHGYVPKLLTVLRQGYGVADFRADLVAGLTVAIVALPLAMALAIASGTTPEKGLHTAIIAGFLISALGGSRVQIGGPTAAFIPVVFNVIEKPWLRRPDPVHLARRTDADRRRLLRLGT